MKKFTAEQRLFLEHMAAGGTVISATDAIGRSRSVVYGWARRDPNFCAQFAAVCPTFAAYLSQKNSATAEAVSSAEIATISLHQLAMQRLEREVRTDGPNAVLASAAIVLSSPQAIATDTPVVEADSVVETPDAPETFELSTMQKETPTMALHRMMDKIFPLNAPRTYQMDTGHVRRHLEQYYGCNLEVELQTSAKSISNTIRYYLTDRFPVAWESHFASHTARLYSVPQPKTRA
jgi:hypothetical protein